MNGRSSADIQLPIQLWYYYISTKLTSQLQILIFETKEEFCFKKYYFNP